MQKLEIYTFKREEVGFEELWRNPAVLVDGQLFDEMFSVKGTVEDALIAALRHTLVDEGKIKYGIGPSLLSTEDWKFGENDQHSLYRGFRTVTDPVQFRRQDGFTFRRDAVVNEQASLIIEAHNWR